MTRELDWRRMVQRGTRGFYGELGWTRMVQRRTMED